MSNSEILDYSTLFPQLRPIKLSVLLVIHARLSLYQFHHKKFSYQTIIQILDLIFPEIKSDEAHSYSCLIIQSCCSIFSPLPNSNMNPSSLSSSTSISSANSINSIGNPISNNSCSSNNTNNSNNNNNNLNQHSFTQTGSNNSYFTSSIGNSNSSYLHSSTQYSTNLGYSPSSSIVGAPSNSLPSSNLNQNENASNIEALSAQQYQFNSDILANEVFFLDTIKNFVSQKCSHFYDQNFIASLNNFIRSDICINSNPNISPEKSEQVIRMLAQFRKIGLDMLFPQDVHEKILIIIYSCLKFYRVLTHRIIIDNINAIKSYLLLNSESVSNTKIRGILALLKQGELITTQGNKDVPVQLYLSNSINSYRDFRAKHDEYLMKYLKEFNILECEKLTASIIWKFSEEALEKRLEVINSFIEQLNLYYDTRDNSIFNIKFDFPDYLPQISNFTSYPHPQPNSPLYYYTQISPLSSSSSVNTDNLIASSFSRSHSFHELNYSLTPQSQDNLEITQPHSYLIPSASTISASHNNPPSSLPKHNSQQQASHSTTHSQLASHSSNFYSGTNVLPQHQQQQQHLQQQQQQQQQHYQHQTHHQQQHHQKHLQHYQPQQQPPPPPNNQNFNKVSSWYQTTGTNIYMGSQHSQSTSASNPQSSHMGNLNHPVHVNYTSHTGYHISNSQHIPCHTNPIGPSHASPRGSSSASHSSSHSSGSSSHGSSHSSSSHNSSPHNSPHPTQGHNQHPNQHPNFSYYNFNNRVYPNNTNKNNNNNY